MNKRLIGAISLLVGTTIGVGIFGLPYAISRVGFPLGILFFLVIGIANLILNLAYAELILSTPGDHQLPGYAEIYLGKVWKVVASIFLTFVLYGVLLAYLIKIGELLNFLFPFLPPAILAVGFYLITSGIVFFGGKLVVRISGVGAFLLLVLISCLIAFGAWSVKIENLLLVPASLGANLLLPYGVLIFALSGSAIIPEVEEAVREKRQDLFRAIVIGSLIPTIIYLIFSAVVIGISGTEIKEDAVLSLLTALPLWVISFGAILGSLAIFNASLNTRLVISEMFRRDFGLSKKLAWILSCLPPLLIYLLGVRSFIKVISLIGSLGLGVSGGLIILSLVRARYQSSRQPESKLRLGNSILIFVGLLFTLGAFLEILKLW
ncbi:hypothetical protein COT51_03770 [candidate division WWE3 bacterium CG08_land_8_20_14_0_20_41_15]|uniref:Amino acid transporter transmembrane domain-containing protein n=2 Tax=Katanobacteria TaxID=422282 RepID=A0A2H0X8I5_UNCKA|nr:MAG: hypothetical protein COT51_03770 [candidate division WWE3 bacterium CG08_land_8_20_14_0_20_41_15]